MSGPDIDWEGLRAAATEVSGRAYAPYSHVHVGAADLCDDGSVVRGCNVENASYGLTLCAECGLVSELCARGGGRLVALSVVAGDGAHLAPCGRCRQVLYEWGGPELLVDTGSDTPTTLGHLLPGAFGPDDLARADPASTEG
ncbi:MAG: cytidine deaminase [Acidimicrobiales bacterium]